MPSPEYSRRRLLGSGIAAVVGLAGCLSDSPSAPSQTQTTRTTTPPTGDRTTGDGVCGTPVGDTYDSVDDAPTPPPCPTRPDPLDACGVRDYVLRLERHLRYRRTLERYGGARSLEFAVYGATVHERESGAGYLVHADLFFSGDTATESPDDGTATPSHFDDDYVVSYLVTPEGQWRATDRTGRDRASSTPRRDGSAVSCSGSGTPRVASLSVADFFHYALAGTHPHVHRRADTQYVVVGVETSPSESRVREGLTLELDGESVPPAERQPVPWERDTVDVAFAVPKPGVDGEGSGPYEGGRVRFEGTTLRTLSEAAISRLNEPPVFEVSDPSVSPTELRPEERVRATVHFDVENTGEGRGTFGASVKGLLSGATTVTTTLDPGERREVTASVRVAGRGESATVRVDWGSDQWSTEIPVVESTTAGTSTTLETSTPEG